MNGRTKKGSFPMIAKKNQGKFTNWENKNKFSKPVVAMANYANNFGCKK